MFCFSFCCLSCGLRVCFFSNSFLSLFSSHLFFNRGSFYFFSLSSSISIIFFKPAIYNKGNMVAAFTNTVASSLRSWAHSFDYSSTIHHNCFYNQACIFYFFVCIFLFPVIDGAL